RCTLELRPGPQDRAAVGSRNVLGRVRTNVLGAPAGSTTGDRNAPNLFSVEWAQYATSPRLRPPDMVGALTNRADLVALGSLCVGMPEWGLWPLFSGLFVGPRGS